MTTTLASELRFGTDGVRGVANVELTAEHALALGRACARFFRPRTIVVARDTRLSGPLLQAALMAGMASEGVDVVDAGVLPTPGAAWLAAEEGCPAAVVSASHNPFGDNGIKLFGPGGGKLSDAAECRIEAEFLAATTAPTTDLPRGPAVGRIGATSGADRYSDGLVSLRGGQRLDGLSVVVDCANGAASSVGPEVLRRLGAQVTAMADTPDGVNINDGCGATSPARLHDAVRHLGVDVGLAFDGDADRLVAVAGNGEVIDGDRILGICALDRQRRGLLPGATVVATVMSNLGLRRALAGAGIALHECPVGDRHVVAALERGGWMLGGEQSGHIVFRDLTGTGDGIVSAVQLLDVMRRTESSLAHLAQDVPLVPQIVESIPVADPRRVAASPGLAAEIAAVRHELGDNGRVLVRPSGTEPVIRVMVESPDAAAARRAADRVGEAVVAA